MSAGLVKVLAIWCDICLLVRLGLVYLQRIDAGWLGLLCIIGIMGRLVAGLALILNAGICAWTNSSCFCVNGWIFAGFLRFLVILSCLALSTGHILG